MASQKVLITGATGNAGSAVLRELVKHNFTLRATAPDIEQARRQQLAEFADKVEFMQANFQHEQSLHTAAQGVDYLVLIAPDTEDRVQLCQKVIQVAKQAGIKFVVGMSLIVADTAPDSIPGQQFKQIEELVCGSGLKHCILRCPLLLENQRTNVDSIREEGKIYTVLKPEITYPVLAGCDLAQAVAKVLQNVEQHNGKVYTLTTSKLVSQAELSEVYSSLLHKKIEIAKLDERANEKYFKKFFSDFHSKELNQLFEDMNRGSQKTLITDDFENLVGKKPMEPEAFLREHMEWFNV